MVAHQYGAGIDGPQFLQPSMRSDNTVEHTHGQAPITLAAPATIQGLSEPSPESDGYEFGRHALWDGIRFLVFSILTLLAVALILVIGGFFLVGFVLFPFTEIPTGFARCDQHWKRFVSYFGGLLNKVFRFVDGLWD